MNKWNLVLFRILAWSLGLLGVFLPIHGLLTVFTPDYFRFWKEVVLIVLFFSYIVFEIRSLYLKEWNKFSSSEWAICFLFVFCGGLVLFSEELKYSIIAIRYLLTGVGTFFLFSRLFRFIDKNKQEKLFRIFSFSFLFGCVFSVVIGIWTKFFGGFDILSSFYSSTISSWVPGQILPLYHETEGFIRMQGGSSGPVAFAHILFLGLFISIRRCLSYWVKWFLIALFLFGIFHSFSRAVLGISIIYLVWEIGDFFKFSLKKWLSVFVLIIISIFSIGLFSPKLKSNFLSRTGTIDHFTLPIKAVEKGFNTPFFGDLGSIGPSARIKNLDYMNDDNAFIAENVFADIFVQIGLFGLFFVLWFWKALFRELSKFGFVLAVFAFGLFQWATVLDMIPISILFFLIFVLFLKRNSFSFISDA